MILIGNGMVITQDVKNPFITNGAVVLKDNLILEVGKFDDLKDKYKDCEFIDAKGKVIMPGLIILIIIFIVHLQGEWTIRKSHLKILMKF